jgi:hypothetical protein
MTRIVFLSVLCMLFHSAVVDAQTRNRNNEPEPEKVYKDSAERKLSEVALSDLKKEIFAFSEDEAKAVQKSVRERDKFLYAAPDGIQVLNKIFQVKPRLGDEDEIPVILLGHNYTSTLVFVDQEGAPWTADMLTDISNSEVFSVEKKAPHIITVRAKKKAGEANLPILLKGEQYPLTLLFKISAKESFFTVDLLVQGYGDHSQGTRAMNSIGGGASTPPARYDSSDEINKLVMGITPEGYSRARVFDAYASKVKDLDFMVWRKDDEMYILTPHLYYAPRPHDVHVSPDGKNRLFVLQNVPIIKMKKYNKIIDLNIL